MLVVEIHERELRLDELIQLLATAKEILLTENNVSVARLLSIESGAASRIPGLHIGSIWVSDDFDAPLPDEFWLGEADTQAGRGSRERR